MSRLGVLDDVARTLRGGVERIRAQLDLSAELAPEVLAAAERAAASPRLPELDGTDLPMATVYPEGARDLDDPSGYVVHYATQA